MTELKFERTVKEFGSLGKIVLASEILHTFAGEEVEITIRRIEPNED